MSKAQLRVSETNRLTLIVTARRASMKQQVGTTRLKVYF